MSVSNIITQLASIEATIPGVIRAFDRTPESIASADLPAAINFPAEGGFDRHLINGVRRAIHQIKIQLFVTARTDLPSNENACRPFIERFPNKLDTEIFLNGSCAFSEIKGYKYGVLEFAGTSYMGIEFILEVREDVVVPFDGGT